MEKKTDILDRITPEEIEEWLLAKREAENLHSLAPHCLNYNHGPGIYWCIQTKVHCVHKETLSDALAELRREEKQPAEALIRERREQAARLIAEADELEGGGA